MAQLSVALLVDAVELQLQLLAVLLALGQLGSHSLADLAAFAFMHQAQVRQSPLVSLPLYPPSSTGGHGE
ncbi:hypothetical protein D3C76_1108180 [compost metagenome]